MVGSQSKAHTWKDSKKLLPKQNSKFCLGPLMAALCPVWEKRCGKKKWRKGKLSPQKQKLYKYIYAHAKSLIHLLICYFKIIKCLWNICRELFFFFFTLQYCIGFAIHQHESSTGVHVFPILNPPPTSLRIPSLWVIPVHQPQASCILHQTWTGDLFLIWYYTCFNAILPNHPPTPSPTKSKRLFYTSVSLLLSCIQGYCYRLSKFHIYALVYCISVFLSGLLHSV